MEFTIRVRSYGHFSKEEYHIARFLRQGIFNALGDKFDLIDEAGRKVVLLKRGVEYAPDEFPVAGL